MGAWLSGSRLQRQLRHRIRLVCAPPVPAQEPLITRLLSAGAQVACARSLGPRALQIVWRLSLQPRGSSAPQQESSSPRSRESKSPLDHAVLFLLSHCHILSSGDYQALLFLQCSFPFAPLTQHRQKPSWRGRRSSTHWLRPGRRFCDGLWLIRLASGVLQLGSSQLSGTCCVPSTERAPGSALEQNFI